jgi:hypothetical protein
MLATKYKHQLKIIISFSYQLLISNPIQKNQIVFIILINKAFGSKSSSLLFLFSTSWSKPSITKYNVCWISKICNLSDVSVEINHRFLSHFVSHGLRISLMEFAHLVNFVYGPQRYCLNREEERSTRPVFPRRYSHNRLPG